MASPELIIVGIDPGSVKTGFGVIHRQADRRFRVLDYGVIRTKSKTPLPTRLLQIYQGLDAVLTKHNPDAVAVEQVFVQRHARSALILGHARGIALVVAELSGASVHEYAATEIKKNVSGSGRATKEQVQHMVTQLLGLQEIPPEDAADALAVALSHAMRREINV